MNKKQLIKKIKNKINPYVIQMLFNLNNGNNYEIILSLENNIIIYNLRDFVNSKKLPLYYKKIYFENEKKPDILVNGYIYNLDDPHYSNFVPKILDLRNNVSFKDI